MLVGRPPGHTPLTATASFCAPLSSALGADDSAPKSSALPDGTGRRKLSWLLAARMLVVTPAGGGATRIGRTCGNTVSAMRSVIGCGG